MKFISKIILLLFSFLFVNNVYAISNPYGKYQDLYGEKTIRCTWYAWQQVYDNLNIALPGWGNAQTWYNSAISSGYSVGKEPKANSIVVYSSSDGYGHVAYVVSVDNEQKTMKVNEAGIVGVGNDGILTNTTKYTSSGNLIGFIYLNEGINESNKNENYISEGNNSIVNKSSNNNLKYLVIEGVELDFDKNILKYDLLVNYDVQVITIKATAENEKAKIYGTGQKALQIGDNTFNIKVMAENGDEKEYFINIKREDSNMEFSEEVNKLENVKESKKISLRVIFVIGILIVILVNIVLILFKKFNKKNN